MKFRKSINIIAGLHLTQVALLFTLYSYFIDYNTLRKIRNNTSYVYTKDIGTKHA